jgi:hypothetical protein
MEFYLRFQAAHPLVVIGKCSFDFLQPFWVKRLKERNVCCYIYHVEMQELLVAFNNMRAKLGLHSQIDCDCDCEEVCRGYQGLGCAASLIAYAGLTTLCEAILCLKAEDVK